jgi:D-alanine-D-alanine ligase
VGSGGTSCADRYRAAMSSVRVAVLFGGRSSEHSISCISGAAVWQTLIDAGYEVLPIALTRATGMVRYDGSPADLRAESLPVVDSGAAEVVIPSDPSLGGIVIDGRIEQVDVVFPVLHGPWGEDGTIQGALELAGLPYVGSGVLASALCMDKIMLKTVLRAAGIAVTDWVAIDSRAWPAQQKDVLAEISELGSVVFVKPSRAGSSMGITRVDVEKDGERALLAAIEVARSHDPRVIVEAAMVGSREIECGVRQTSRGAIEASVCAEIVVKDGFDFYDFDAKYVADGAELVVPAEIPAHVNDTVRDLAARCFGETGCESLARVDFFATNDSVVVNELNTMPGFTPISMFPRMWQESGVNYTELVVDLVQQALGRPIGLR